MTMEISGKPSLLASLPPLETKLQPLSATSGSPDGFATRLDTLLSRYGQAVDEVSRDKAQALAEVLNLQMLQTTLGLAGDAAPSTEAIPITSQTTALKTLLATYTAQQPEAVPAQELPEQAPAVSVPPPSATSNSRPAASGGDWLDPIIAKASRHYGVDVGLIKAVIKAESNFNPQAVSSAGARGLMQLMPSTARSLGVTDSFDPEQNVMAGTRFLGDLLNRYKGDLDAALAAYNWGPGNVDRRPDRLPRETRTYLGRVKELYAAYTS